MTQLKPILFRTILLALTVCLSLGNSYSQWTVYPGNITSNFTKVHFYDANHGMAVGDTLGITTDGGNSWNFIPAPTVPLLDVHMTGPQAALVVGSDQAGDRACYRTSDMGLTWIQEVGGVAGSLRRIAFSDSLNGFVAGDDGSIYTTGDGGDNWACLAPITTQDYYAASMPDAATMILSGPSGAVHRTTNGGTVWDTILPTNNRCFYALDFITKDSGVVAGKFHGPPGFDFSIFTYFISPQPINSGKLTYLPTTDIQLFDLHNGFSVSGENVVWRSFWRGSWVHEPVPGLGPNDSLRGIHFVNSTTGFAVGDNGTIIRTTTGGNCSPNPRFLRPSICLGDSTRINVAFGWSNTVVTDSATGAPITNLGNIRPTEDVTYYFEATHPTCGLFRDTLHLEVHYCDSVWPGDANADGVANMNDLLALGFAFGSSGTPRVGATNNWVAQAATDFGPLLYNLIDYKHADCDGNGLINASDTLPISLNYGLTHNKNQGLQATSGAPIYLEPLFDSLMVGDTGYVRVMLGDAAHPVNNLHGIAFSFAYDPSLIDTNSVSISFDTTWISPTNSAALGMYKDFYFQGITDAGYTHINQLNSSGYGMIAGITFVTIDNISGKRTNIYKQLPLSLGNVVAYDGEQNAIPIASSSESVVIWDIGNTVTSTLAAPKIKVYPNPGDGLFHIDAGPAKILSTSVYDIQGRLQEKHQAVKEIDLRTYPSGMYFLQIKTTGGTSNHQLHVHN